MTSISLRPKFQLKRKRQWGAEKRTQPLPIVHDIPSARKITFSRIAIVATIVLWVLYILSTIIRQFIEGPQTFRFTMEAIGYAFVVTMLTFSALMYLVARQGAYQRFSKHVRVPRALLDKHFSSNQPSITVLVPSYSEEPDVIRKTLLSASLQEFPGMRIVLLVDDNPYPSSPAGIARLNETRHIGNQISDWIAEPKEKCQNALMRFSNKKTASNLTNSNEMEQLAKLYGWTAEWLTKKAGEEIIEDHVDIFFAEQVLFSLAQDIKLTGEAILASLQEGTLLPRERLCQLYRRLAWIFDSEIEVFERKKYASLSHEPNKAMNLNAYIGLMGGIYQVEPTHKGPVLVPIRNKKPGALIVPDSEFVLTLDADSILLREYCLRLVYELQQPKNARVAVTQTPYSSFRGARTRIERLAAATTDIQHILHQGMSHYGATFWVGANAVIRKKALEDIAETDIENGFEIKRYIQDQTVIEDTESSIDLAFHDWSLLNYPERLSYSATPPDFGSLVVQRRRWANGGLLIFPKLLDRIRKSKLNNEVVPRTEFLLRTNYMASIAWASFGLIFLLAFPYDGRLLSPLVLLAALPYFLAMASDLKYCGYKRTDVFRIYGFNLILLPVNLAGVLKSIQQAMTGKKIPFARTPKVKNRTATSVLYIIAPLLIVAFSILTFWRDASDQNWGNAAFAAFNALVASWAIIAYIGIRHSLIDIFYGLTKWLYVEVKPKTNANIPVANNIDWKAVLYHGDESSAVPIHVYSEYENLPKKVGRS